MTIKASTQTVVRSARNILLASIIGVIATPGMAETTQESRSSKSISFFSSSEINLDSKDALLSDAEVTLSTPLIKYGYRVESNETIIDVSSTVVIDTGSIWIYDVSTDLISDFDGDAYYHRFSVAIDADTDFDVAYVYAKLYISYEGGPWNHYSTSDAYHIYTDSAHDRFVIETELADGFPSGYYDVRVVLYDADTEVRIQNYGPYDDDSLSTLPLEGSYYDDGYSGGYYPIETEIVIAGTGSTSVWLLIMLVVTTLVLRIKGDEPKKLKGSVTFDSHSHLVVTIIN